MNSLFDLFRLDSLRHRIMAFALAATVLPSVATAWISYRQQTSSLTQRVNADLEAASQRGARSVRLWLQDRYLDLKTFASSYEVSEALERGVRGPGGSRLDTYLSSVQKRFAVFEAIQVLDPRAVVVASSNSRRVAPPLPEDWKSALLAGQVVFRRVRGDETGGRTLLVLAVPVTNAVGRLLGAIAAQIDMVRLTDQLADGRPGPNGRVMILDEQGSISLSMPGDSAPSSGSFSPARLTEMERPEGIVEYVALDEVKVVGKAAPMARPPWTVVAEIPAADAYRQVTELRNMILLVVVGMLGVGLVAYRLALVIVRPLDRLTAGAEKVAGGDLSVDLPVTDGGEVGLLTRVFNDMVTKIREGRQELERLSLTDGLTGLYNRRHLMAALESEVRRVKRQNGQFSILIMDVDHFKRYNDTYGHQAGDEVLRGVAAVIRSTVREVDTASRYGGEEMVAMLPDTSIEGALDLAERIRARLAEEPFPGGNVTLSIGAATFPEYGETVESLIASADAALYQAKREGRDRVVRARRRRSREINRASPHLPDGLPGSG